MGWAGSHRQPWRLVESARGPAELKVKGREGQTGREGGEVWSRSKKKVCSQCAGPPTL